MAQTATWTKLRKTNTWGIKVHGKVQVGDLVKVQRQSGVTTTVQVTDIVWSDAVSCLCAVRTPGKYLTVRRAPLSDDAQRGCWDDEQQAEENRADDEAAGWNLAGEE